MNQKLTLTAALASLMVTGPVLADNGRYRDRGGDVEYARVIRAEPIYRQIRVDQPRQECREERVVYRESSGPSYRNPEAGLLGGIIGGVAGYQFGKGSGQAVATAAGALIGASIGHNRYGGGNSGYTTERVAYEPRCTSYNETRYEQQLQGYDVTYQYQGRTYHTETSEHPGRRIPVRVQVSPVSYRSY